MGPWKELLAGACTARTLQRAKSALGRHTEYKLGQGGVDPTLDLTPKCDCSGFVAWAIGVPRELPPGSGHWLQTTTFWEGGPPVGSGLFHQVPGGKAEPGDLYVYGDHAGSQGHIGIITAVDDGRPTAVIHCSMGNWRRHRDAVRETDPGVFSRNPRSRIMRVDYDALRGQFGLQPLPVLQHPLLRDDPTLRRVVAEHLVLKPTGGPVDGCGAFQDGLNHLAQTYPECRVDWGAGQQHRGYYGPKTEQAIKNFQAAHNIQANGWIGHDTTLALDAALLAYDASGTDTTRVPDP